jgi:hypothetical protein
VAGTAVELKDKDGKTLAKLIAGKQNVRKGEGPRQFPIPMGRYVLAPSRQGENKVALVREAIDIDTKPESWVKRDFIKIENPESIALQGQAANRHWTLTRNDPKADWKLADANGNEKLNNPMVNSFTNVLNSLTFNDVLPPETRAQEHGLDNPELLTARTFDGFNYILKIGKLSGDNYPVTVSVAVDPAKERTPAPNEKPEDKAKLDAEFKTRVNHLEDKAASEKEYEKRMYLIPKSSLDPLLKDRADLLVKASPSPVSTAAPSPTPRKKR